MRDKAKEERITLWVFNNRGLIRDIAAATGVTSQMVSMVLRGRRKSTNNRVERKLRESGAPL